MLVSHRKELNLTQAELALKLSKPQSFVSKYESGERKIDAIELIELIQYLGDSPSDFIRQYCLTLEKIDGFKI
ncbi:MAG: transcriptional regulator [Proteobacteria bacterium]|nr:MAG: transcriptional regulator [Pseudomonadota bacterium]